MGMSVSPGNPDAKVFLEAIEHIERQIGLEIAFLKKTKARIEKAKRAIAGKPGISGQVSALLIDLKAMQPGESSAVALQAFADSLEQHLHSMRQRSGDTFSATLRRECESHGLPFKSFQDGFGIGPFKVVANHAKEVATLHYAKHEVAKDIPLSPLTIVERAAGLRAALIAEPVDVAAFSSQLEEAMRVAVVRQRRQGKAELRADLPSVYREMVFIREGGGRRGVAAAGYPLPRFVVELKSLVQSEQNMKAANQFRLEPAVIENTKDAKKSVFIPNDIQLGYGEGTYCQAVTLRSATE